MGATIRPFAPADAGWVVEQHAAIYAREEGFDDSFRAVVDGIVSDFVRNARPGRDAGWIACRGDHRLGCIFVVGDDAQWARLRLVLLLPESRGTGLAQRMMDTALTFARGAGYARMRLWTHESQVAAVRLYARNGFSLAQSESKRAFGQEAVAQTWQRDL